jgi:hypothetical protein
MSELRRIQGLRGKTVEVQPVHGKRGDLRFLPISQLYIDPSYQREILGAGERNVRRIAERFDWSFFAPLIVARRGLNEYAVIDGQHRATAAVSRGDIQELPCLIVDADYATQAKAFSVINGEVTRLNVLYIHRAAVAAGDSTAVQIDRVCKAAGISVAPYPKPKSAINPTETLAIGTLATCLRLYGEEVLLLGLRLLVLSGAPDAKLLNKATIQGSVEAFAKNAPWRRRLDEAVAAVRQRGIEKIYTSAMHRQAEQGQKEYANFRIVLIEVLQAALGSPLQRQPQSNPAPQQAAQAIPAPKVVPIRPLPPPPAPPRTEPPTDNGNFDVVAYLKNKGLDIVRDRDGFREGRERHSKAGILTIANRYRRAAELPDLTLADIA